MGRYNRFNLKYCSETLRKSEEILLSYVRVDGLSLEYVDKSMRKKKEIVLEAVKQNGNSYRFVHEDLRYDKDVILALLGNCDESSSLCSEYLQLFVPDRSFALDILSRNPLALEWLPGVFQEDEEMVKRAVAIGAGALQFCSEELKNNKEVVEIAFRQNWKEASKHVGKVLKEKSTLLRLLDVTVGDIEQSLQIYYSSRTSKERLVKVKTQVCGRSPLDIRFGTEDVRTGVSEDDEKFWTPLFVDLLSNEEVGISTGFHYFDKEDMDSEKERENVTTLKEELRRTSFGDFTVHRLLGRGAYGGVYLCTTKNVHGLFGVKLFNDIDTLKEEDVRKLIGNEIPQIPYHKNVMSVLSYKSKEMIDLRRLADYDEFWIDKRGLDPSEPASMLSGMVVVDYCKINLEKYLKHSKLTSFEMCFILMGVVRGIGHLHSRMVVHRDLHPGNIFVHPRNGRVWVGDFGCSIDLRKNPDGFLVGKNDPILTTACGTGYFTHKLGGYDKFLAPEISKALEEIRQGDYSGFVDYEKSDMYSVGKLGMSLIKLWNREAKYQQTILALEELRSLSMEMSSEDARDRVITFSESIMVLEFIFDLVDNREKDEDEDEEDEAEISFKQQLGQEEEEENEGEDHEDSNSCNLGGIFPNTPTPTLSRCSGDERCSPFGMEANAQNPSSGVESVLDQSPTNSGPKLPSLSDMLEWSSSTIITPKDFVDPLIEKSDNIVFNTEPSSNLQPQENIQKDFLLDFWENDVEENMERTIGNSSRHKSDKGTGDQDDKLEVSHF